MASPASNNKAIKAAVSARFSLTRQIKMAFLPAISLHGEEKFLPTLWTAFCEISSLTTFNTGQGKMDGDFQMFLISFPFSLGNTGFFRKRRMKQEFFSGLLRIDNAEKAIPATARRKKSRKPLADFLLGVPLHGGGYSVVGLSVKPELR